MNGVAGASPDVDARLEREPTAWIWAIPAAWTVLIGLALWWNVSAQDHASLEMALATARTSVDKDVLYRRWAARHGGVYVPVSEQSPPNPNLAHLPERDLTTPSGIRLTLVNPAYMTRQVGEMARESHGPQAHITSLKPIRPENAPSPWERTALERFERGEKEVYGLEEGDGGPVLKYMQPLLAAKPCLKCHAAQGYREGDIRGGLSVTVPLAELQALTRTHKRQESLAHGVVWLLGLTVFGGAVVQLRKRRRERTEAERALVESERKARAILDLSFGFVGLLAPDGTLLEANKTALDFAGVTLPEVKGRPFWETAWFAHSADVQALLRDAIREAASGKLVRIEATHRARDGAVRTIDLSVKPARDEAGRVVWLIPEGRDITERLRMEEKLRESEFFFRESQRAASTGSYKADFVAGRWTSSSVLDEIFGIGPEYDRSIPGWLALIHPADREAMDRYLRDEVLGERKTFDREYRIVRKSDGATRWVHGLGRLEVDREGKAVALTGIIRDVTAAKGAEEALRKAEGLYRAIVENEPECVKLLDREGRILEMNPAGLAMIQAGLEQVRGGRAVNLVVPEHREAFTEMVAAVFRGERRRLVFDMVGLDGRRLTLETTSVPLRSTGPDGPVDALLGVTRDVTARLLLERQLRQAQKMEAVGQLAGGIAHDFNNILAAMIMALDFLRANPTLDPEGHDLVGELKANAERAANLTRQLLLFSRRSVLSARVVDLNALVGNLLKMLERLMGEDVALAFEPGAGVPAVSADAGMLEQVLVNLAVNARDAMPRGGRISLSTRAVDLDAAEAQRNASRRSGAFACLTVTDTGCGMSAATREHLFEPFFTTKEVGAGTGLGLATVHGIVSQHEGWIEVDTEEGKGTSFRIYLPATSRSASAAEERPARSLPRGSETVLVVEDEASVRKVLLRILRSLGYGVLEASNGVEALAVWASHAERIDLLFTDMVMPEGMTGLELAAKLRAEKPDLRVVVSSGYSVEVGSQTPPADPEITFLHKPYDVLTLGRRLRECLDRRGAAS